MFFIFKNFIKQYRLNKAFQQACFLLEKGKAEEAFNSFNSLLSKDPFNLYLRHQILMLGKQLDKEVILPTSKTTTTNVENNNKKLFTLKLK